MDEKQAVQSILNHMSSQQSTAVYGIGTGTIGSMEMLQRSMNTALTEWHKTGSTEGLKQFAAMLLTVGKMSRTEYEQILEALGEK